MSFVITGLGRENISLKYEKQSVRDAGYLASKMADNGCNEVRIYNSAGRRLKVRDALQGIETEL